MKLPPAIIREIMALPEGKAASFTIRTDGKQEWKLELHKTVQEEEKNLIDLSLLWTERYRKAG